MHAPQKVGSKLERREYVYKRTAKVQRDFLRKKEEQWSGGLIFYEIKKSERA
jgi:hypothetical protein